jgi:hypothetical protein
MDRRPGCLGGLFELFMLQWLFDGLQKLFGFRSNSCLGCGCGFILLILFIILALGIIFQTDWFRLTVSFFVV